MYHNSVQPVLKALRRAAPAVILAVAVTLTWANREAIDIDAFRGWVEAAGPAGPLLFIVSYAVLTVLIFPGAALTLAGGATFGPWLGTLYNITGATAGATIAFLLARYLTRDLAGRYAGGKLGTLRAGIEQEGWRFVAFVRLVPVFPFNLLNYALGLTRIGLFQYVATSFVCMLPGAAAYTWVGHAGSSAIAGEDGTIQSALWALGLLATVAVIPRLISSVRGGGGSGQPASKPGQTGSSGTDQKPPDKSAKDTGAFPKRLSFTARNSIGTDQDTMPSRFRPWVVALSMAGFTLAALAWLNETWFFLFESPIWFNRYTENAIIVAFGVWRIISERNPHTRRRLIILVTVVGLLWGLLPWLFPFYEPHIGYLWSKPVFPSLHTPGTLTFVLALLLVLGFGRRVICGFGCPCVGIRETVGFPFRDATVRGKWAWRLRHSKWFFFFLYVGVMVSTQFPPNDWTVKLVGFFGLIVGLSYYGSFYVAPITGNRFYCRYLCPYGATFGILNQVGFYGIKMDRDRCIDCRRCEQACDMGIPVWQQGRHSGHVTGIEDCMGCARCVVSCPTDALEIRDVRNLIWPKVRRSASRLLSRNYPMPVPREEPPRRTARLRLADWKEAEKPFGAATLTAQARRCLDCGEPGCREGCPLGNHIPAWLAAAAVAKDHTDTLRIGDILHEHSPFPELCGTICPQHLLCEGSCTRQQMEGAVTIGRLERNLSDAALSAGWMPPKPAAANGHTVAVVGAGPAGLGCAELLNRQGFNVTVYDREEHIGGLLKSGIPSFKLDRRLLERRHALLSAAGVDFRLGQPIDQAGFTHLLSSSSAVFLGVGAQKPRALDLPGFDLSTVTPALAWLTKINAGVLPNAPTKTLVLGGGDTALDCARAARRMGSAVTVAYRGPQEKMRASAKEILLGTEEGVQFVFEHKPQIAAQNDNAGITVVFDTPGGERSLDAGQVIVAFGQLPSAPPWLSEFGIDTNAQGLIAVDAQGRTTNTAVWAGGDGVTGPSLAVKAMAAGRLAAQSIVARLQ